MILSDRSIREAIEAGRIVIEPFADELVQPSSIDVRLDRLFRVFRNHTAGVIDVKKDLAGLTEQVEIDDDGVFMLHPGEFVLASTLERVGVPDDLVGRIEGKSSLARLGLLIHSSLPASEPLLVLDGDGLVLRTIGELVKEPRPCSVVAFDPDTLEVDYHQVTGWYEGPPDRVYEIRTASGRRVSVSAGHNVFTSGAGGDVRRVRTADLCVGTRIAVARRIPDPPLSTTSSAEINVIDVVPEAARRELVVSGPAVAAAFASEAGALRALLRAHGHDAVSHYRRRVALPFLVACLVPGLLERLDGEDRIGRRAARRSLPAVMNVDEELAWLLGMYVATGRRRRTQLTISNIDQRRLDRVEATCALLGLPVHRAPGAVTCRSSLLSDLLGWFGTGDRASARRIPLAVFGWPGPLLEAFVDGVVDGNGSRSEGCASVWTTSEGLVADLVLLFARLDRCAVGTRQTTRGRPRWQVDAPADEDTPLDGGVAWDRVVEVVDTGRMEPLFDLEVRPAGRPVENFLAGAGGVFVSNTAGFVDAGFEGHITLELANVASLPITLYPGMKIGQISFMQMTTAADRPYGKGATGSKYQGQRGPTPSRYFENFRD